MEHSRLRGLRRAEVCGVRVPVATGLRARLLGLSFLPREAAGIGLLIPHCRCIHSFGMRFSLDLVFFDRGGRPIREVNGVSGGRIVACPGADSVLEVPSAGV